MEIVPDVSDIDPPLLDNFDLFRPFEVAAPQSPTLT
jgi:hypothetical protein